MTAKVSKPSSLGTTPSEMFPPLRSPSAWHESSSSSLTPSYYVACTEGSGQVFEVIRDILLKQRRFWRSAAPPTVASSSLLDDALPPLKPQPANPSRSSQVQGPPERGQSRASAQRTGVASGRPPPCCNRLANISLYLGDKLTTERFSEDARIVAMRERRASSAVHPIICAHTKAILSGQVPLPSQKLTVVNYWEGFRCITLKSRMVKTLLQYHKGSWAELGKYLPRTFQLIPERKGTSVVSSGDERVDLVDCICDCNQEVFDQYGEIASYWVAKQSHGSHGDDIRIFYGDQAGLDGLIAFIDGQKEQYAWVVSRYIDRPLLYQKRKFDLRCWVLVTPKYEVYLHRQLVMRTSSETYDRSNLTTDNAKGRLANITNHCVQATGTGYSKYESGNELWRSNLDVVVQEHARAMWKAKNKQPSATRPLPTLDNCIIPQIKRIVVNSINAARQHTPQQMDDLTTRSFQLMGYDFLIDERLVVWLLEINGSPGVAQKLIDKIASDTVEMVIDTLFPSVICKDGKDEYADLTDEELGRKVGNIPSAQRAFGRSALNEFEKIL